MSRDTKYVIFYIPPFKKFYVKQKRVNAKLFGARCTLQNGHKLRRSTMAPRSAHSDRSERMMQEGCKGKALHLMMLMCALCVSATNGSDAYIENLTLRSLWRDNSMPLDS